MTSITNIMDTCQRYYVSRKYEYCKAQLKLLMKGNSSVKQDGTVEGPFKWTLENNMLICDALALPQNDSCARTKIEEIQTSFLNLLRRIQTLPGDRSSLDVELCVTNNTIWLHWIGENVRQHSFCYLEKCMEVAVRCFNQVLKLVDNKFPSSELQSWKEKIFLLMEQTASKLMMLTDLQRILLIQTMCIVSAIIIENCEEHAESVRTLMSSLLKVHKICETLHLTRKSEATNSLRFFTFDLLCANGGSMAACDKSSAATVFETLYIVYSVATLKLKYEDGQQSLEQSEEGSEKFQFLRNYLKAYILYHQNHEEDALSFLLKIQNVSQESHIVGRYHLLLGLVYSKQCCHNMALEEFQAAEKYFPILSVYYAAQVYQMLNMTEAQLKALEFVIQEALGGSTSETEIHLCTFQRKLLDIVHCQSDSVLSRALFTSAMKYFELQKFEEASENFLKLLSVTHSSSKMPRKDCLPSFTSLLHATVVSLLKSSQLGKAETVCEAGILRYKPLTECAGESLQEVDANGFLDEDLLHFDNDVASLIMQAEVYSIQKKWKEAQQILKRCLKSLGKSKSSTLEESSKVCILANALSAKVCLQRAKICICQNYHEDAAHFLKRSIIHNADDEDAIYQYVKFLDSTGKKEEASVQWISFRSSCKKWKWTFKHSVVLQYILETKTSKEDLLQMDAQAQVASGLDICC